MHHGLYREYFNQVEDHIANLLGGTNNSVSQFISHITTKIKNIKIPLTEHDIESKKDIDMYSEYEMVNQKTTYQYNVRSWLTSLQQRHFGETLKYTHGGNISNQLLNTGESYMFSYDRLSRLY